MTRPLNITILGLSITSSWGNGHATVFRSLCKALAARGHAVVFLERDVPWYAAHRDMPDSPFARIHLYQDLDELTHRYATTIREADAVIVGSYVPQGADAGRLVLDLADGVKAFYDIDTPVTLARLARGDIDYLAPDLIPRYDLYLSFTGGPTLTQLEEQLGSPCARPLYCCVDPELYFPQDEAPQWDLGYMGTYSDDRQPVVESLLLEPARKWAQGRFVVAGPQYPPQIKWPANVHRIEHLPPHGHRSFYNRQRFTLNVTRADMVRAGHAPSVRLFEAAACGTPIISDYWNGLESFFELSTEILVSESPDQTLAFLHGLSDEDRAAVARRARDRVLAGHTADHRAAELEAYLAQVAGRDCRATGATS